MATPNALFAIINVSNLPAMRLSLSSAAPWISLELQDGQWLLVAPSATTTKEVADKLDANGSDTVLVLRVDNYFGRAFPSVWEWIKTKKEAELVATTAPA